MVQSKATTVDEYLDELEPDRREVVEAVLATIRASVPGGFEEGVLWVRDTVQAILRTVRLHEYPVGRNVLSMPK